MEKLKLENTKIASEMGKYMNERQIQEFINKQPDHVLEAIRMQVDLERDSRTRI